MVRSYFWTHKCEMISLAATVVNLPHPGTHSLFLLRRRIVGVIATVYSGWHARTHHMDAHFTYRNH